MLLIDADTPAFAAASVHEDGSSEQACWEANATIERLLKANNTDHYKLYLTGENNFRYNIFPEYKANRIGKHRPKHLQLVRESLVYNWGAHMSNGNEADDEIGIQHWKNLEAGEDSTVCSIDKDLDQLSGRHYHPGIKRLGVWIREPGFYTVSPNDALRFFYYQLLVGDVADGDRGGGGRRRHPLQPEQEQKRCDQIRRADDDLRNEDKHGRSQPFLM